MQTIQINIVEIFKNFDSKKDIKQRKLFIKENIDLINKYLKYDVSNWKAYQIAKVIIEDLNIFCECGEIKDWNDNRLKNNCKKKECSTRERNKSNILKYGVEHPSQSNQYKQKFKQTCLLKYGVENPAQTEDVKSKMKKTNIEKYGSENYFSSEAFKSENIHYKKKIENEDKFTPDYFIKNFICDNKLLMKNALKFYNYQTTTPIYQLLTKNNISFAKKIGRSLIEEEFKEYYKEYNILKNSRKIINAEIDLFFKDYNLGIEFNGLYWHSLGKSNTNINQSNKIYQYNRHIIKTNKAHELNIDLFHIFENELRNNTTKNIWLSMINNKLNLNSKIYARKCEARIISSTDANNFLKINHIQGMRNSKINIGLFYNNELVSIATFGKPLNNKCLEEYELHRFCNKIYFNVVGGASKLLSFFEKNYQPSSLITYANKRWSRGKLYEKLGFSYKGSTQPNKFIINKNKLESRLNWQKHKLKDKLEIYDENLSADQNIINNGYRIIWDCGNMVFSKQYNKGL